MCVCVCAERLRRIDAGHRRRGPSASQSRLIAAALSVAHGPLVAWLSAACHRARRQACLSMRSLQHRLPARCGRLAFRRRPLTLRRFSYSLVMLRSREDAHCMTFHCAATSRRHVIDIAIVGRRDRRSSTSLRSGDHLALAAGLGHARPRTLWPPGDPRALRRPAFAYWRGGSTLIMSYAAMGERDLRGTVDLKLYRSWRGVRHGSYCIKLGGARRPSWIRSISCEYMGRRSSWIGCLLAWTKLDLLTEHSNWFLGAQERAQAGLGLVGRVSTHRGRSPWCAGGDRGSARSCAPRTSCA